jgi:hypothetical protein
MTNATAATKQIAALIGATPRSGRSRFALDSIRTQAGVEALRVGGFWSGVLSGALAVGHAVNTGRLSGEALCAWREMSEYRQCRVVALVTAQYRAGLLDDELVTLVRSAIGEVA